MSQKFRLQIVQHLSHIFAESFSEDTALIATSKSAAAELTVITRLLLLSEIGHELNNQKSMALCLDKDRLSEADLTVDETTSFKSLGRGETIKYLEITIHDEVVLDQSQIITKPATDIWQTLAHPLQFAPLSKIHMSFLDDSDKIVRTAVK
jgi:hypothetical protein